jgi:hypothetical protein
MPPVGTAHRNAHRSGSHLLAAASSSLGDVQRNLLSGEGGRHGPVPCAWQSDSAEPLQSVQPVWRDPLNQIVVGHALVHQPLLHIYQLKTSKMLGSVVVLRIYSSFTWHPPTSPSIAAIYLHCCHAHRTFSILRRSLIYRSPKRINL